MHCFIFSFLLDAHAAVFPALAFFVDDTFRHARPYPSVQLGDGQLLCSWREEQSCAARDGSILTLTLFSLVRPSNVR